MLLSLLILIVPVVLGVAASSLIRPLDTWIARTAVGIPFGISIFMFAVLLLYVGFGYISYASICAALLGCAVAAVLCYKRNGVSIAKKRDPRTQLIGVPNNIFLFIVLLFIAISAVFVTSVYSVNGALYCNSNEFCSTMMYDIGATSAPLNHRFPAPYTFSLDTLDVFPLIYGLYTSILIKYGLGMLNAFMVTDILMIFSFASLSVLMLYKASKNTFVTVAASLIFWFGTNFAIALPVYALSPYIQSHYGIYINRLPSLQSASLDTGVNQSILNLGAPGASIHSLSLLVSTWVPPINSMLLPERSFMLGLALGLSILYIVYVLLFESKNIRAPELIFLGILTGMLPLANTPTFVAIVIIGAFAIAYTLASDSGAWMRRWAIFLTVMLPLSTLQLLYMLQQPLLPTYFNAVYDTFYVANSNPIVALSLSALNLLLYWVEFLGLVLPLALIGLYKMRGNRKLAMMAVPAMAIWLLVSVLALRPYSDNSNNILLFALLPLSMFAAYSLQPLLKRPNGKAAAFAVLLLICGNYIVASYSIATLRPYVLLSPEEVNATNFILNNTNPNSLFAVNDFYSQFGVVPSLASRRTILSSAEDVLQDASTYPIVYLENLTYYVFQTQSCTVIRRYNVSYLYFTSNPLPYAMPGVNITPFSSQDVLNESPNLTMIYSAHDSLLGDNVAIYQPKC